MKHARIMIVNHGGLRSLVTTAAALAGRGQRDATPADDVVLLHLRDGRPNADTRAEMMRRQAEHYGLTRIVELPMPHLQSEPFVPIHQDGGASPLIRPQTLLVALGQAIRLKVESLHWSVQVAGDFATIARVTEEVVLIEQMLGLEQQTAPRVDMPLLELTDQQLVELGGQLEVPFEHAWSCMTAGPKPCNACAACQHRRAAFEAAGMMDPLEKKPAAK